MREVVFVDGMRTPFGKMGGSLKTIAGSNLAAMTVKALVAKTGILEKGGKYGFFSAHSATSTTTRSTQCTAHRRQSLPFCLRQT